MKTMTQQTQVRTFYAKSINGSIVAIEGHSEPGRSAFKLVAKVDRSGLESLENEYPLDGTNRQFTDQYHAAKAWCERQATVTNN